MIFETRESHDHPGFWIAQQFVDGQKKGFTKNPNPIDGKPDYIFATEDEAAATAVARGFTRA